MAKEAPPAEVQENEELTPAQAALNPDQKEFDDEFAKQAEALDNAEDEDEDEDFEDEDLDSDPPAVKSEESETPGGESDGDGTGDSTPEPDEKADPGNYEKRYKDLQSRTDKVDTLNRNLVTRLEALEAAGTGKDDGADDPAPVELPKFDTETMFEGLTEEDRETWKENPWIGRGIEKMMGTVQEGMAKILEANKKQQDDIAEQRQDVATQEAQAAFVEKCRTDIDDYENIIADPAFRDWNGANQFTIDSILAKHAVDSTDGLKEVFETFRSSTGRAQETETRRDRKTRRTAKSPRSTNSRASSPVVDDDDYAGAWKHYADETE